MNQTKDYLKFMELLGKLKHLKRTGWVLRDVSDCETVAGHMYRMSMLSLLLDGSEGLDRLKIMELALVHDLAECIVGDITPYCGVSKEDKIILEFEAMDEIAQLLNENGKERLLNTFKEYEDGISAESKFVKDLDRLDMIMQAFEYEKRDKTPKRLEEFFESTKGKFKHPFVQKLVQEIYQQREEFNAQFDNGQIMS